MKQLLIILCLLPCFCSAQTDLLMLKKGHAHVITYSTGMHMAMQTIYDQWFDGTITAIRHDSIFLNGTPFHYKEIRALQRERTKLNYKTDGTILMIAGGGVLVLGAVNGLYRNDQIKDWYSPVSFITAGALILGGYCLTRLQVKQYVLGKKYNLEYLELNPNKNGGGAL